MVGGKQVLMEYLEYTSWIGHPMFALIMLVYRFIHDICAHIKQIYLYTIASIGLKQNDKMEQDYNNNVCANRKACVVPNVKDCIVSFEFFRDEGVKGKLLSGRRKKQNGREEIDKASSWMVARDLGRCSAHYNRSRRELSKSFESVLLIKVVRGCYWEETGSTGRRLMHNVKDMRELSNSVEKGTEGKIVGKEHEEHRQFAQL